MATRPTLRLFQSLRAQASPFRQQFQQVTKRQAQTSAPVGTNAEIPKPDQQSGFAKLWNSPVGPKTVHFWAPVFKWGLVLAGISDLARPASQLSLNTNAALVATGAIWTRWCFVIKPKNYALAAVNFFLFLTGTTQVTRILLYQQSLKNNTPGKVAEAAAKEDGKKLEGVVEDVKQKVKEVVKA